MKERVTTVDAPPAQGPTPARDSRRDPAWRDSLRRWLLAAADVLTLVIVPLILGAWEGIETSLWALAFLPGWLILAKLHGLYDRDHRSLRHLTIDELPSLLFWAGTGTVATDILVALTPSGALGIGGALGFAGLTVLIGFTLRVLARALWRRLTPAERVLVVGAGSHANRTRRKLELFGDIHAQVSDQRDALEPDALPPLDGFDRVIVATDGVDDTLVARLLEAARRDGVKLSLVPPTGAFGTAVVLTRVGDLPVVEYNTWDISRSTLLLKRAIDVVVSFSLLVLLSPLMALVAVAIAVDSRGHPVFVQRRSGRLGRPFRMLKFRTMVPDAEARLGELVSLDELQDPMFKLAQDPRVTRLGGFLRRTSLDELPQLVNVLNGDMSLVGPRPEQLDLVDRYLPEHRFRLLVKPGLTGPMQVYGRGELTFVERLAVERDYIENLSIGRDLRILALTVAAVVSGRGAF